jgi:hypothetical protein
MGFFVVVLLGVVGYLLYKQYKLTKVANAALSSLLSALSAGTSLTGAKRFVDEYAHWTNEKPIGSDDEFIDLLYKSYGLAPEKYAGIDDRLKQRMIPELHELTRQRRSQLAKVEKTT